MHNKTSNYTHMKIETKKRCHPALQYNLVAEIIKFFWLLIARIYALYRGELDDGVVGVHPVHVRGGLEARRAFYARKEEGGNPRGEYLIRSVGGMRLYHSMEARF